MTIFLGRTICRIALVAIAFASIGSTKLSADTIVFDFESQPADGTENGSLTSLTLTQSDFTAQITRSSGSGFDVLSPSAAGSSSSFPAAVFGSQALSPFTTEALENDVFIANFSSEVSFVSIDAGDFGQDTDAITLVAYAGENATGGQIGFGNGTFNGNLNGSLAVDAPTTVSVSVAGIRSVTFVSNGNEGNSFNSAYFDNLTVVTNANTVPEPSTGALLACVLGGCLRRRR